MTDKVYMPSVWLYVNNLMGDLNAIGRLDALSANNRINLMWVLLEASSSKLGTNWDVVLSQEDITRILADVATPERVTDYNKQLPAAG